MIIFKTPGWVWYFDDDVYAFSKEHYEWLKTKYPNRDISSEDVFDEDGKWLYFCKTYEQAEKLCSVVVSEQLVYQAKHTLDFSRTGVGVCCFYMSESDIKGHKKLIGYLKENDFLQKNKDGSYRNIAFKSNFETQMGLYGEIFKGQLHLADIIDLKTGAWSQKVLEYERQETEHEKISELTYHYNESLFPETSHIKKGDVFNSDLVLKTMHEKNKSIKEVAEKVGVSEASIKAWLKGQRQPTAYNAFAVGYYLGLGASVIRKE